jgi:hypothetical protein
MLLMRARQVGAPLLVAALAAGCGGNTPSSPSTPTPSANLSPAATQAIVGATLTQGTTATLTTAPDGSRVMTYPCPGGGSMTITSNSTTPAGPSGAMTNSSRMELSDCQSQSVTVNGDPYITIVGDYSLGRGADGTVSSMTANVHMTGGVRFSAGGTQGRAQYDCTSAMSMQFSSNGTVSQPPIVTSTGTITWEQPLGAMSVRPCGT